MIEDFRETTGYTGPLYTDPSLAADRAAHLKRGLGTLLTVGALTRSDGALRRGFRQGRVQGDALPQGGTLVIATDGRVLYQHVSTGPGVHAPLSAILAALP